MTETVEGSTPETLHPRVRVVWAVGALAVALFVLAVGWLLDRLLPAGVETAIPLGYVPAVAVSLGAIGVLLAAWRYRVWRFQLQEDALFLERGVFTRVETAVPYVRVQHIDTHRGPLERLVGLSSVVVYTAGSRGADVTVPGLSPERARALRDRLRDLAVAAEPDDAV